MRNAMWQVVCVAGIEKELKNRTRVFSTGTTMKSDGSIHTSLGRTLALIDYDPEFIPTVLRLGFSNHLHHFSQHETAAS